MQIHLERYSEKREYGQTVSAALKEILFPEQPDEQDGAYETLVILQGPHIHLGHVDGYLLALTRVNQALWDEAFTESVGWAAGEVQR